MTLIGFDEVRRESVLEVARAMLVAAKTAPKGRGVDNLVYAIAAGPEIGRIAARLRLIAEREGQAFFGRDAGNLEQAEAVVLLGARISPLGLKYCGLCGFGDCAGKQKHPAAPCVFNTGDLGIAVGSAVSVAAAHRVDNRVMYTVGMAVKELGLLGGDVAVIYGIPLSATAKSPFFDRG